MNKKKLVAIILTILIIVGGYIYYERLKVVEYEVEFYLAPIKTGEYMKYNDFINLLIKYRDNRDNINVSKNINKMKEKFNFNDSVELRNPDTKFEAPEYEFNHNISKRVDIHDITTYFFNDMQKMQGIPYIKLNAIIPVKGASNFKPKYKVNKNKLTTETKTWPVKSEVINNIIINIIEDDMSSKEKIDNILEWMNENIEYGGELIGSRYGVIKVINQGYGQCWDLSDVFITLSRAAGISARLVTGWVYKKGGHGWAQVYLSQKGWVTVDPAFKDFGVPKSYIPFSISEDGEISYLYWSVPKIKKI